MLPARIDAAEAITLAATGQTPKLDDAPAGLFDEIVEGPAALRGAAERWLRAHERSAPRSTPRCIGASNRESVRASLDAVRDMLPDTPAAHAVVEAVEIGIAEGFSAGIAAERRLLVSLRHTEAARSKLEAFFAKNR
jgi:enoyl-CoA hydratase/carnithine racemase